MERQKLRGKATAAEAAPTNCPPGEFTHIATSERFLGRSIHVRTKRRMRRHRRQTEDARRQDNGCPRISSRPRQFELEAAWALRIWGTLASHPTEPKLDRHPRGPSGRAHHPCF